MSYKIDRSADQATVQYKIKMTYLLKQLQISDIIVLGLDDFENDFLSGTLLLGCSS